MAHQAQELGARSLERIQRRQILQRDNDRLDLAVRRPVWCGVDQHPHAATVGDRELEFLGMYGLGGTQELCKRCFAEGDFPPVRAAESNDVE